MSLIWANHALRGARKGIAGWSYTSMGFLAFSRAFSEVPVQEQNTPARQLNSGAGN